MHRHGHGDTRRLGDAEGVLHGMTKRVKIGRRQARHAERPRPRRARAEQRESA